MVIDLEDTDPSEWQNDKSPPFSPAGNLTDAVIYELADPGCQHPCSFRHSA
jgi:hypothetical protein